MEVLISIKSRISTKLVTGYKLWKPVNSHNWTVKLLQQTAQGQNNITTRQLQKVQNLLYEMG